MMKEKSRVAPVSGLYNALRWSPRGGKAGKERRVNSPWAMLRVTCCEHPVRDAAVGYMSLGQGHTLGSHWCSHRIEGGCPGGEQRETGRGLELEALSLILPLDPG